MALDLSIGGSHVDLSLQQDRGFSLDDFEAARVVSKLRSMPVYLAAQLPVILS